MKEEACKIAEWESPKYLSYSSCGSFLEAYTSDQPASLSEVAANVRRTLFLDLYLVLSYKTIPGARPTATCADASHAEIGFKAVEWRDFS